MSFIDTFKGLNLDEIRDRIENKTERDVHQALSRENRGFNDFLSLISKAAMPLLEYMALEARRLTYKHFGKTVSLYIPLYISNECNNSCVYCGFRRENPIKRRTLSLSDIEHELNLISKQGFKHILLLTGEAPDVAPLQYIAQTVSLAKGFFPSVSIEVYPMSEEDYRVLASAGADGITLYQETYNEATYKEVHPRGPKMDFGFRLGGIERAARAGMRSIGIGILLGLAEHRLDAAMLALHAEYLLKYYWQSFLSISFPRLREVPFGLSIPYPVSDRDLVQLILSFRLCFKEVGLVISTREPASLRDNLIPLGITRLSAGSHTEPGGYSSPDASDAQFYVEDKRSPHEVEERIRELGYEPVWKDWSRELG